MKRSSAWRRSPSRRSRPRRAAVVLALLAIAVAIVAGCGIGAPQGSVALPPRPTATPQPTVSVAVEQTRLQVAGALATAGYQLTTPTVPFRPPETTRLAAVPRSVFQVALPNDPTHGYIVIYELPDAATATLAGNEMAKYLGAGEGRIQFTPQTQFVLRQVGTTLIFYNWAAVNSPGPDAPAIGTALTSVGQGFAIPQ